MHCSVADATSILGNWVVLPSIISMSMGPKLPCSTPTQYSDRECHICDAKNVLIMFVGPERAEYNGCNFCQVLRVCFDADIKFQLFIVLSQTPGLIMTDFIQLKFNQTQFMRLSGQYFFQKREFPSGPINPQFPRP